MKNNQTAIENIIDRGMLNNNISWVYLLEKRLFDFVTAFILLILSLPVLLVTVAAVWIKLSGSAFLVQERYGYRGKKFRIIVLNTCSQTRNRINAGYAAETGIRRSRLQTGNSNQLTRVGHFILRVHIDKWPQLLNILKGDMSFVGPHAPKQEELDSRAAWYGLGMSAKPGVTGLWHNTAGKTIDMEELIRLDLKYIRERSFLYDIKIFIRSCCTYFKQRNI